MQAIAELINATVIGTSNEDILRVNQNGQTVTVRLGSVDASKHDQLGEHTSTDRLRQFHSDCDCTDAKT